MKKYVDDCQVCIMSDDECPVCYESLHSCATTSYPGCGHRFHVTCMLTFAQYNARCPVCRCEGVEMRTEEELSDVVYVETVRRVPRRDDRVEQARRRMMRAYRRRCADIWYSDPIVLERRAIYEDLRRRRRR